ncbi:Tryptophan--tRNA ligase, mitochondrial [Thoreauomyces humboldtii]|nr:Tryptophan--tRNA ligase, mitochondrial [Thoreauomyces humboldtii]
MFARRQGTRCFQRRGLSTAGQASSPQVPAAKSFPSRVLSGIQPTAVPHLGNYLGALDNWVRLQDSTAAGTDVLYSIVDLHALTVPQDPAALRSNVRDMAACLLACGIREERSVLFRQSRVPQHSELAWLLFCRTPIGWLSRMHQWKTKLQTMQAVGGLKSTTAASATLNLTSQLADSYDASDPPTEGETAVAGLNVGLLTYPVLQAADILIYRATEVPIGEDQVQHMEMVQMAARSFNSHYKKEVFPIPKGLYASTASKKILSLRTPTSKMSKSDPSEQSRINLDDTPDQIRSKIRRATVDSIRGITYDPERRPGVANLVNILSSMCGETPEEVAKRFEGAGNEKFKEEVAEAIAERLGPIREELVRLRKDKGFVDGVLERGEERAQAMAARTLRDIQKVVGLR